MKDDSAPVLYFLINISCFKFRMISLLYGIYWYDEAWMSIRYLSLFLQDDVEEICLVYDHFLSKFPLCYGYWGKYAAHMTRLCTTDKVVEVFEQAVLAATYSVGMWVDYCSFAMSSFEDPSDIRR